MKPPAVAHHNRIVKRSFFVVEDELPRSIGVAREAQVVRKAQVHSKLHGMIACYLGPVIDKLVLVLVFNQRAVATGRIQAVSKVSQRAVKLERREASGGRIAGV